MDSYGLARDSFHHVEHFFYEKMCSKFQTTDLQMNFGKVTTYETGDWNHLYHCIHTQWHLSGLESNSCIHFSLEGSCHLTHTHMHTHVHTQTH